MEDSKWKKGRLDEEKGEGLKGERDGGGAGEKEVGVGRRDEKKKEEQEKKRLEEEKEREWGVGRRGVNNDC